jgi:hypothetical protein
MGPDILSRQGDRERERKGWTFFFFLPFILVSFWFKSFNRKRAKKKRGNALDINCIRDAGVTVSVHFSSSEGMKFHSVLAHPSDVGYSR